MTKTRWNLGPFSLKTNTLPTKLKGQSLEGIGNIEPYIYLIHVIAHALWLNNLHIVYIYIQSKDS